MNFEHENTLNLGLFTASIYNLYLFSLFELIITQKHTSTKVIGN